MALRLEIKVIPSSGKIGFIIDKQQRLRCYLKAAAQDGQANYELIKFVAKTCGVTQRDVDIVAGLISRNKVLLISTDLTYEQFLQHIGLEKQAKIF
ncbi:MAG: DUF167 domain-containing protein [Candidatus Dependentiae bacterium]|nr:DUF167 domain-containing protein [Candidatus Dependentiae bacterium]